MDSAIAFMESMGIGFLFVIVFVIFRGSIRKGLEWLTGVKIVRESKYGGGLNDESYEGMILETSIIIVFIACFTYPMSFNNFPFYVGFVVSFFYPFLILLLRIRTFSDSSIKKETGIGYHPAFYFILSLLAGGYMTTTGFSMLNFSGKGSLTIDYSLIIMGLIAQSIPLFPDYLEKIFKKDLRNKGGMGIMALTAGILFMITSLIIWLIT